MAMRWRWPPENSCGNLARVGRIEPDEAQQLADPRARRRCSRREAEGPDRLGDDVAHAPARIEAGVRILEDHLDAAAQLPAGGGVAWTPSSRRRRSCTSPDARRQQARPPCWRRSTCRSRIRRPARRSRRAGWSKRHAVDGLQHAARPSRASVALEPGLARRRRRGAGRGRRRSGVGLGAHAAPPAPARA